MYHYDDYYVGMFFLIYAIIILLPYILMPVFLLIFFPNVKTKHYYYNNKRIQVKSGFRNHYIKVGSKIVESRQSRDKLISMYTHYDEMVIEAIASRQLFVKRIVLCIDGRIIPDKDGKL